MTVFRMQSVITLMTTDGLEVHYRDAFTTSPLFLITIVSHVSFISSVFSTTSPATTRKLGT